MKTITLDDTTYAALLAALTSNAASPPPVAPPVVTQPSMPTFVVPATVAARSKLSSPIPWGKGSPTFHSPAPLNDANVWVVSFVAGPDTTTLSFIEAGGPSCARNWVLMDNTNGEIVAMSTAPTQAPGIPLNGISSRLAPRTLLTAGRRYTVGIWNATPGVSSAMVGQFYF